MLNRKTENLSYQELISRTLPANPSPLYKLWVECALQKVEVGKKKVAMVERHLSIAGKRILDIGCGDGGISIAFAKRGGVVSGIDSDPNRIERASVWAQEHGVKVDFLLEDGEHTHFASGSFDLIICNAVIEHVYNPEQLAEEISRLLRTDGFLFLDTPNKLSFLQLISDTHFCLFGISMLPRWLAEFYVVTVRRRHVRYDVDALRTYSFLVKVFRKHNIVFLEDANIRWLQEEIINPELLQGRSDRRAKAIRLVQRLHLIKVAKQLVGGIFYRHFVTSGWSLIGRKVTR